MSLEKFKTLLEKASFDRTDEDIAEMERLLTNQEIRFFKYFNNDQGQAMQTTQYNNSGAFLSFIANSQYPDGELIMIKTADKGNVYVPSSFIEF